MVQAPDENAEYVYVWDGCSEGTWVQVGVGLNVDMGVSLVGARLCSGYCLVGEIPPPPGLGVGGWV